MDYRIRARARIMTSVQQEEDMFKKTSILMLALLLALSIFAVGCGSNSDDDKDAAAAAEDTSLADIQEKGTLVLGCDDEFAPMGFRDEDGNLTGFDIELAGAVCEKLGVKLDAKPINWDSKELELTNKNIDVIWNGYSITPDRNKQVEFTKPYLKNKQMIAVNADSAIKSKDGFKDKILGVQNDSAAQDAVNKDETFLNSLKELRPYDDYQNALIDLEGGNRIDGVAGDEIMLKYAMQQKPGKFILLDENLQDEYYGIGCRAGEVSLREAIDKALDELYDDGTIDKLSKKYFNENIVIRDIDKLTQEQIEDQ